jgi:hypothetical protein
MENVAALQRIAEKLLPNPYFCRHDISFLQVLIRDEGRCVYCKRDLFESHDIASEVDHLLPRSFRSDLLFAERTGVSAPSTSIESKDSQGVAAA